MILNRKIFWAIGGGLAFLAGLTAYVLARARAGSAMDATLSQPVFWLFVGLGIMLTTILSIRELLLSKFARLGAEARSLRESGDFSRRLNIGGPEAALEMADQFNELLAALAKSRQQEQQLRSELEHLRRSEEQPDPFFAASPIPHVICTLGERRIVEANGSFLALLGFAREEIVGHTDTELALWPEADARESWWQLVQEKRSVRDVECLLRTHAGELRNVVTAAEAIEFRGQDCVLLTIYDLTERSSREVHLRQTQKLEAVGRLAAGFAHDFNNILCIIQGHTSLLQSEPLLDPDSNVSLKQIATATERAANLTRQMLTFSRKQIMKPKTMDLNLVLHGLSNMLLRILGDDVALKFNFSAEVPLVDADTGMLEQLVMNLVMNARDAMPQGGQLTVTTSTFVVDHHYVRLKPEAYVGQFACLSVSDTGRGLEAAAVNRIFEPFFTTKDVGKGSGMGLATAYGIMKQHNGWIEVASQPGQGTTFKVFLPASQASLETATPKTPAAEHFGGTEKLFVVEDEPGLLALVTSILQHYGYNVITATNGTQALEVWAEHKGDVDLLVTDIVMPEGMTGRELAEKLHEQNPALKVIYTSGYSADLIGVTNEELVEGVNFIQKPYRPQNLAQAVRQRLDGVAPASRQDAAPAVA